MTYKMLVTAGSYKFDELMKFIDNSNLNLNIICQIGKGEYIPKNYKWVRFQEDFEELIKDADVVITHTGCGTIFECAENNKMTIMIPVPAVVDNHDVARKLASEGNSPPMVFVESLEELEECSLWNLITKVGE